MFSKYRFLFAFIVVISFPAYGQFADTVFRHPLDLPTLLSGTFAELRSNHFHSGIDFRTQGTVGHPVFASESGYISRIFVSPGGYGKALYISHPNGYTTVYGHLDSFNDEIAAYVKEQQYKRETFRLDLYPDSARFVVTRGQQIGKSGNTGGSGGPHLHFEVRNSKTEEPLNPMLFGFGVKDKIAPTIRRVAVYPVGDGSTINGSAKKVVLPVEKAGKTYRITGEGKLVIRGNFAFGIDAFDQTSGSANKCGPYNIKLLIDSTLYFSQTMNMFSFDETRYINSLIDYDYYIRNKVRINRLYAEPNNQLRIYDYQVNRGIVSFGDSANHKARIVVRDLHGNQATLDVAFSYVPDKPHISPASYMPEIDIISGFIETSYKKEMIYKYPGIKIVIPRNSLYDNIDFEYRTSKKPAKMYSKVHHIHNQYTPLHKAITIQIDADSLPGRLQSKALLAVLGANGRWESAGGKYNDGVVQTNSRLFGDYAIAVDTVPPRVVPINIKKGAVMTGVKNIRFKITDDFSGIDSYNGWIDDQWVLFEYDAKNDLIFYDFDPDKLTRNTKHSFRLLVTDGKGNKTEYKTEFTW